MLSLMDPTQGRWMNCASFCWKSHPHQTPLLSFLDLYSAVVAQHLRTTIFFQSFDSCTISRWSYSFETKALALLAPANAVADLPSNGGLSPNLPHFPRWKPLHCLHWEFLLVILPLLCFDYLENNLNSRSLATNQLMKFIGTDGPKMNHVAGGAVLLGPCFFGYKTV